jgi:cupin fold WbuC family metalloprotein
MAKAGKLMSYNSIVSLHDQDTVWRDKKSKSIGFFTKNPLRCVTETLLAELEEIAIKSGQNARLSLHSGPGDTFHEMIIFQHADQYYPPKKHLDKDKSFHMIKGEMVVVIFSEMGEVVDARRLEPKKSPIYRIAKNTYHTDIPISDYVIHHESTLGPFLGNNDRIFAEWAAEPKNKTEFLNFRERMIAKLAEFE